jgi:hypothetical protein
MAKQVGTEPGAVLSRNQEGVSHLRLCSLAALPISSRDSACLNTRIEALASTNGNVWLLKNPTLETVSLSFNHVSLVKLQRSTATDWIPTKHPKNQYKRYNSILSWTPRRWFYFRVWLTYRYRMPQICIPGPSHLHCPICPARPVRPVWPTKLVSEANRV